MSRQYTASDIEVLSGLEPVRKRPGMYTDTSRPNHLAHEVIDNSVDEALAGYCKNIKVILHKDGSLEVEDDGPGLSADILPRIFEPYFSTHDSGTGLGLPISKRIIEEHGGRIIAKNLESGGLGVHITLPMA